MKYLKTYKIFDGYYNDDVNAHITSVVLDIFQDIIDESDFDIE